MPKTLVSTSRIHLCSPNYLYLYSHDSHPLSYLLWLWTWTSKHRIEASPNPLQVVLEPIGIVGGLMTVTACNTNSLCSSSRLYLIRVHLWRILRTQHNWSRQCSMPGFNQIGHVYSVPKKMAWQEISINVFITIEADTSCLTWGHFTHNTECPSPLHFKQISLVEKVEPV